MKIKIERTEYGALFKILSAFNYFMCCKTFFQAFLIENNTVNLQKQLNK